MDKNEALRRLVFIKYLYDSGIEQSKKPEPFSWQSVLTFHDTVELCLVLIAEYLDQSEKALRELSFTKYWDIIDPLLKHRGKNGLTQRISMERLNDARNAFKHRGTSPSEDTINSSRTNVGNFLEENMMSVMGIDISNVSLVDFVYLESSRISLREATQLLKENKRDDAIDKISLALRLLIDDYTGRKCISMGHDIFSFSNFSGSPIIDGENSFDIESAFDEVQTALNDIEEPLRVLALGLDYRKYVRFDILTNREVFRDKKEGYKIRRKKRIIEDEPSKEELEFCINFVIECALILKQFDFELKKPRIS